MIHLHHVTKLFNGANAEVRALEDVSLRIEPGQVFGVIGSSGAGKSTLIRCINLLERPTSGQVFVGGQELTALAGAELTAARRRIGMIFQHFNLLSSKTVADNVAFPLKLAGDLSRAAIRQHVEELLARVGLSDQAHKYPAQLSGGQKQRVGIARALACKPDVLLCDEATSALDPQTTRSILRLVAELNRELGLTVVLITHEMEVVRRVCDQVAVLDAGRVVENGSVENVFLHPRHTATQRLVLEAERVDTDEQGDDFAHVPGRIVRVTLRGDDTYAPLLGHVARETGVDFSILSGRIDRIKDTPCGQLTIALTGGDPSAALARIAATGAHIEEVRP